MPSALDHVPMAVPVIEWCPEDLKHKMRAVIFVVPPVRWLPLESERESTALCIRLICWGAVTTRRRPIHGGRQRDRSQPGLNRPSAVRRPFAAPRNTQGRSDAEIAMG
jgi:hypothetical protein